MNIVLKDKIKIDNNFINDLIVKSWQDSESIQNQINCIETGSAVADKTVKLLKDLLTSYYIFTGCLENLYHEMTADGGAARKEEVKSIPKAPTADDISRADILNELDNEDEFNNESVSEPFEYFVDFDEPIGEPLTDDDLYN